MMKKIIVATKNQGKIKEMINAFKKFTCRTSFFK